MNTSLRNRSEFWRFPDVPGVNPLVVQSLSVQSLSCSEVSVLRRTEISGRARVENWDNESLPICTYYFLGVNDGRIEGRVLIFSCKNSKTATH